VPASVAGVLTVPLALERLARLGKDECCEGESKRQGFHCGGGRVPVRVEFGMAAASG
jgi:hypothetical protein